MAARPPLLRTMNLGPPGVFNYAFRHLNHFSPRPESEPKAVWLPIVNYSWTAKNHCTLISALVVNIPHTSIDDKLGYTEGIALEILAARETMFYLRCLRVGPS